ncbi:Alkylated DNA repair protein AlkB [gamma proteobacterium IMCC2047]|nr:Alkylated DNA repair protein AlkB [gamma proteobacterium IMCC2047]
MSQNDFFQSGRYQSISLAGGELLLIKEAFPSAESAELFNQLRKHIAWSQDEIYVAGRRVLIPRLQAWYGDAAYRYSGLTMKPLAWTPLLRRIKQSVDAFSNCQFNSVLLNLYRDGNDSMGWHSDDEPELGCNPVIASLRFGG